jgi:hypothetical protein
VFIGGSDDLAELSALGELGPMLRAPAATVRRGQMQRSAAQQRMLTPQLLVAPGGGRWWLPQLRCWANQTRLVSAIHVCLFTLVLLLLALDVGSLVPTWQHGSLAPIVLV